MRRKRMSHPMEINNIHEAIPIFLKSLLSDDLFNVDVLLRRFPKLIKLKDKGNRNVLMLAAYGRPIIWLNSGDTLSIPAQHNNHVVSYLMAFWVDSPSEDSNDEREFIDINETDKDGFTAFDWAILSGNYFAAALIKKMTKNTESNGSQDA